MPYLPIPHLMVILPDSCSHYHCWYCSCRWSCLCLPLFTFSFSSCPSPILPTWRYAWRRRRITPGLPVDCLPHASHHHACVLILVLLFLCLPHLCVPLYTWFPCLPCSTQVIPAIPIMFPWLNSTCPPDRHYPPPPTLPLLFPFPFQSTVLSSPYTLGRWFYSYLYMFLCLLILHTSPCSHTRRKLPDTGGGGRRWENSPLLLLVIVALPTPPHCSVTFPIHTPHTHACSCCLPQLPAPLPLLPQRYSDLVLPIPTICWFLLPAVLFLNSIWCTCLPFITPLPCRYPIMNLPKIYVDFCCWKKFYTRFDAPLFPLLFGDAPTVLTPLFYLPSAIVVVDYSPLLFDCCWPYLGRRYHIPHFLSDTMPTYLFCYSSSCLPISGFSPACRSPCHHHLPVPPYLPTHVLPDLPTSALQLLVQPACPHTPAAPFLPHHTTTCPSQLRYCYVVPSYVVPYWHSTCLPSCPSVPTTYHYFLPVCSPICYYVWLDYHGVDYYNLPLASCFHSCSGRLLIYLQSPPLCGSFRSLLSIYSYTVRFTTVTTTSVTWRRRNFRLPLPRRLLSAYLHTRSWLVSLPSSPACLFLPLPAWFWCSVAFVLVLFPTLLPSAYYPCACYFVPCQVMPALFHHHTLPACRCLNWVTIPGAYDYRCVTSFRCSIAITCRLHHAILPLPTIRSRVTTCNRCIPILLFRFCFTCWSVYADPDFRSCLCPVTLSLVCDRSAWFYTLEFYSLILCGDFNIRCTNLYIARWLYFVTTHTCPLLRWLLIYNTTYYHYYRSFVLPCHYFTTYPPFDYRFAVPRFRYVACGRILIYYTTVTCGIVDMVIRYRKILFVCLLPRCSITIPVTVTRSSLPFLLPTLRVTCCLHYLPSSPHLAISVIYACCIHLYSLFFGWFWVPFRRCCGTICYVCLFVVRSSVERYLTFSFLRFAVVLFGDYGDGRICFVHHYDDTTSRTFVTVTTTLFALCNIVRDWCLLIYDCSHSFPFTPLPCSGRKFTLYSP